MKKHIMSFSACFLNLPFSQLLNAFLLAYLLTYTKVLVDSLCIIALLVGVDVNAFLVKRT